MTSGVRRAIALVLATLTCVGIVASTVAVWAHRTTFDNQTWVETVSPVIDDPDVQAALARHLTDAVVELVDLRGRIEGVLPAQLGGLAGTATEAIQRYAVEGAATLVASDVFRSLWVEANRLANQTVVDAVRNGSGVVVIGDDGQVGSNLLPFIPAVLDQVRALLPSFLQPLVPAPQLTPGASPDEQRAELGEALGVDLPAGFGVVNLETSAELARIQTFLGQLDERVVLLPILTLVLAVGALAAAPDRRRILVVLGIGTAVGAMAAAFAYGAAINSVLSGIADAGDRAAVRAVFHITTTSLRHDALVVLVAAVVLAVVAWLAGRPWARRELATEPRLAGWVDPVRVVVAAAAGAALWVLTPSWWALAAVAAALIGIEAVVTALGRRAAPPVGPPAIA